MEQNWPDGLQRLARESLEAAVVRVASVMVVVAWARVASDEAEQLDEGGPALVMVAGS